MSINLEMIKRILEENGELSDHFGKYSKVYLSATENVRGILESHNLSGKKILSVAGSGDQALNAFFKDADGVTLFDVNPLAFAQAKLKFAAAQALDYKEFSSYFSYDCFDILNYHTYKKIEPYLDDEVAAYYEFLYSKYIGSEIFSKTVFPFYPTVNKLERINNYMSSENYPILKEKIQGKRLLCIETEVTKLPEMLDEKYNAILLSNLSDSLDTIYDVNALKCYKRFIHILSKHLERDGFIQCGYIYNNYKRHTVNPIFANDDSRRKIFTSDEFREKDVESYQFYSSKDKVVTYEKRRKVS